MALLAFSQPVGHRRRAPTNANCCNGCKPTPRCTFIDKAQADAMARLAAKLMVAEIALYEVIRHLPSQSRLAIASTLKAHAAATLQREAEGMTPNSESAYALSVAAYLEAAHEK